jgi:hypothetical protein
MCYQNLRVNRIDSILLSKVMSAVLEANRERTKKLSVLTVEQCEDG